MNLRHKSRQALPRAPSWPVWQKIHLGGKRHQPLLHDFAGCLLKIRFQTTFPAQLLQLRRHCKTYAVYHTSGAVLVYSAAKLRCNPCRLGFLGCSPHRSDRKIRLSTTSDATYRAGGTNLLVNCTKLHVTPQDLNGCLFPCSTWGCWYECSLVKVNYLLDMRCATSGLFACHSGLGKMLHQSPFVGLKNPLSGTVQIAMPLLTR